VYRLRDPNKKALESIFLDAAKVSKSSTSIQLQKLQQYDTALEHLAEFGLDAKGFLEKIQEGYALCKEKMDIRAFTEILKMHENLLFGVSNEIIKLVANNQNNAIQLNKIEREDKLNNPGKGTATDKLLDQIEGMLGGDLNESGQIDEIPVEAVISKIKRKCRRMREQPLTFLIFPIMFPGILKSPIIDPMPLPAVM